MRRCLGQDCVHTVTLEWCPSCCGKHHSLGIPYTKGTGGFTSILHRSRYAQKTEQGRLNYEWQHLTSSKASLEPCNVDRKYHHSVQFGLPPPYVKFTNLKVMIILSETKHYSSQKSGPDLMIKLSLTKQYHNFEVFPAYIYSVYGGNKEPRLGERLPWKRAARQRRHAKVRAALEWEPREVACASSPSLTLLGLTPMAGSKGKALGTAEGVRAAENWLCLLSQF